MCHLKNATSSLYEFIDSWRELGLFRTLVQRPIVLQGLFVLIFDHCHENSRLRCCRPPTTIICRSGPILIKGLECLSLTRMPMKIGVASGNKDKFELITCFWSCPADLLVFVVDYVVSRIVS